MANELTLRIVLDKPPSGVDFALQKGRGNSYETLQKQRSAGGDVAFEFTVGLKTGKDGGLDFTGPFVQGPVGGRFIYIDIGSCAGQADTPWSRRLKVPLSGITDELRRGGTALETRVPGKAKDGGPNCATVKPFAGWRVSK